MATAADFRAGTGRSGEWVVMAEFVLRGYNVAVPGIDRGDDLLVLCDATGEVWRVQVKTCHPRPRSEPHAWAAQFWVPMKQLLTPRVPELYYVLAVRAPAPLVACPLAQWFVEGDASGDEGRRGPKFDRGRRSGREAGDLRSGWVARSGDRPRRGDRPQRGDRPRRGDRPQRKRDWKNVRGVTTGVTPAVWEFLVISRRELAEWHEREGFGTCHNYQLLVSVTFRPTSVLGHERDLQPWRNRWERYWPAL